MVVLRPPNGWLIEDVDLGCSWEELVVKQQRGDFGEITKETVEQGDTIAMLDRNCITEKFGRRVFVHLEDEVYAFIFDEDGNPIDEPSNFVTKGPAKVSRSSRVTMGSSKNGRPTTADTTWSAYWSRSRAPLRPRSPAPLRAA